MVVGQLPPCAAVTLSGKLPVTNGVPVSVGTFETTLQVMPEGAVPPTVCVMLWLVPLVLKVVVAYGWN